MPPRLYLHDGRDCLGGVDGRQLKGGVQYEEMRRRRCVTAVTGIITRGSPAADWPCIQLVHQEAAQDPDSKTGQTGFAHQMKYNVCLFVPEVAIMDITTGKQTLCLICYLSNLGKRS